RATRHGRIAVGEAVELAARALRSESARTDDSTSSGVLVDTLSSKLLGTRFRKTPRPDGTLLLGEEQYADASRLLLGKPTPCVGRETELSTLEAQLTGCIEDREPRIVLVSAPPGTGKSRLRHEFLRRVAERSEEVTVVLGCGNPMTAGAP